jgi:uncharacterized iron-regulated membrane protein
MKSFGVCVGLVVGLTSLPALASSAFNVAQATPPAPAAALPEPAAPAAATPAETARRAAAAKPAKARAKAKAKTPAGKKVPSAVSIENKSHSTLKSLKISLPGEQGKTVGKLDKEVVAGKAARVVLKGANGCEYKVIWELEDGPGEGDVDLCGDHKIVVTD